jgi:hypothetical protein
LSGLPPDLDPWGETAPLESVPIAGGELRVGDRVRLQPGGSADIFDLALSGRVAFVEAIERDYDEQVHVAVVVEDDPGRDLGADRMVGHRFFFKPHEVERL